jgi:hypothetical protein
MNFHTSSHEYLWIVNGGQNPAERMRRHTTSCQSKAKHTGIHSQMVIFRSTKQKEKGVHSKKKPPYYSAKFEKLSFFRNRKNPPLLRRLLAMCTDAII